MNTIWIVEYGCSDLGEQDGFSAAYSTQGKAIAHAMRCAGEHSAEDPTEEYEVTITNYNENDQPFVQVNLRNTDYEWPNDWWIIREVPFDR